MRKFSREAFLLYAVMLAAVAAFVIGHIAYVDLGFSDTTATTGISKMR